MSFKGLGSKKKRASLMSPSVTRKKSKMETKTSLPFASLKVASQRVATYSPSTMCRSTVAAGTGILGNMRFKKFEACSLPLLGFAGSSGLIRMTSGGRAASRLRCSSLIPQEKLQLREPLALFRCRFGCSYHFSAAFPISSIFSKANARPCIEC